MPIRVTTAFTSEPYDEATVQSIARRLREEIGSPITLALAFCGQSYISAADEFLETLRIEGHILTLGGCSAQGVIHSNREYQNQDGLSVIALNLPEVEIVPQKITSVTDGSFSVGSIDDRAIRFAIALLNPFAMDIEGWFQEWNRAHPSLPLIGGLASSLLPPPHAAVFLNEEIIEGGLLLHFRGPICLESLVSQACRPIGEPMTITQANENILFSLGTVSAYEVLNKAFENLPDALKAYARGNLFVGLAINEYQEEFKQGDFLIRNILGADPNSGAVAVGARVRVGQTLQFQLRDPILAREELNRLLELKANSLKATPVAALLFACNGRGKHLFQLPHHDAALIHQFFPDTPLAGFFCNGEIAPVHGRNYLHGYTASLALLVDETKAKKSREST
ncbi:MAG: FIST C-terminal domain-containing protein [Methylacidiphilales bacterium]|nr:FIST C-terminal domain-containing protein [Candidatus Methylacidiphilales bacterium]MDW8348660.1 FIST C-terminal domain-containing protein [Verrucomicrobiae bacterium]